MKREKTYFAAGCFWGVEYYFKTHEGVLETTVGYAGGPKENVSYKEVCAGGTGHAETVEVVFDPEKTSYEAIVKFFFSIHDFSQVNRQGPDIGEQYRSEIFYIDDGQKQAAERVVEELKNMGHSVATKITPFSTFCSAEDYHQDYYAKTGHEPYCHRYKKIF